MEQQRGLTRRAFVRAAGRSAAAAGLGVLAGPVRAQRAAADPCPNILFLLSDDHSYPYLSCYGNTNVRTPNLDRLAAAGMAFHCCFTAAPQCVPSRAALLSGRSPVATRTTRFSAPLPRDEVTFMEVLRQQAGYFVGVCGRSYHLDGSAGRGEDGRVVNELLRRHGLKTFAERLDYVNTGSDEATVSQMAEFLDRRPAEKPFCLWLNFSDPHHVWDADADAPDPATLTLPAHLPDLPGVRRQLADYCGEVNRLDRSVQRVLELLDQRGLADSTLVVFAGDNGMALPHGKGSLYDPGLNVPFLVRWPGVVKPGGESQALISGEDLAPTLLAAAGLPAPKRMSGVSFLPLLRGEAVAGREVVFAERGPHGSAPVSAGMKNSGYDLSRCVRSERFKFIYNCTPWIPYAPVDSAGGPGWQEMTAAHAAGTLAPALSATYFTTPRPVYELYDLVADPSELNNLSGKPEHVAVERQLRQALAEKMIVDFDYLPLPGLGLSQAAGAATKSPAEVEAERANQFQHKDTDRDGRLSRAEFSAGREPADAATWFDLRDVDADGFVSRHEFLPGAPLPKPAAR